MSETATEDTLVNVYRATLRPLYAFVARRAAGDRTLAEDVTQEAWLRAVADWSRKGVPREPLAWLCTAARNLLANWYRGEARKRLTRVELELDAQTLEPRSSGAAAAVQQGMAQLRRADAELLEAFHVDGLSMRDLAANHRCSEKAIEGRLRRARVALARVLEPWILDGEPS
jgi:RNA polymerase sigma-70 factor (ECF subfamily)